MIDDVNIHDQYQYDAHMFDGFISHRGDGTEFGRIPVSQVGSQMNVGGFRGEPRASRPLTNDPDGCLHAGRRRHHLHRTANQATLNPGEAHHLPVQLDQRGYPEPGHLHGETHTATSSDQSATDGDRPTTLWVRTFDAQATPRATTRSIGWAVNRAPNFFHRHSTSSLAFG